MEFTITMTVTCLNVDDDDESLTDIKVDIKHTLEYKSEFVDDVHKIEINRKES